MRFRIHNSVSRRIFHEWFAWRPVRAGMWLIWLERVDRRAVFDLSRDKEVWEYRPRARRKASELDGTECYR